MELERFLISCPDVDVAESLSEKFQKCREAHLEIHQRVLGHPREETSWIVLDDCLSMAYEQMMNTLLLLDEKSG